MKTKSAIVFLDRDGTINKDYGYVTSRSRLELLPGVAEAIASLGAAGFTVVVVTNQSAIGRGLATQEAVDRTNLELQEMLLAEHPQAQLHKILVCPHAPEDACPCRKPATGMLVNFPYDFSAIDSWVVGDKMSDMEFGANVGIPESQRILLTADSEQVVCESPSSAWCSMRGLDDAARLIVGTLR